jgi:hypothetical protein
MRGRALFRDAEPPAATYCICVPEVRRESKYSTGRLEAIVTPEEKLIVHHDGDVEYYDLIEDPLEQNDLADERPERVVSLLLALREAKETVAPAPDPSFSTDPETIDKLRALGYIK